MADILLDALNKKDYGTAKELIQQGRRLHDIEEYAFEKALYSYLADYRMMEFLTQNGYNAFFFPRPQCRDGRERPWGVLTGAFVLKEYRIMDLLFGAGFNLFVGSWGNGCEWYWVEGRDEPYPLWKWLFTQTFNKAVINMMLSHGCPAIEFDDPDYHDDVRRYINSKPQIKLKSFALGYWWNEIPVPKVPHFGLFTLRSTKEHLNKKYEEEMQEYEERSKIRKEYIDRITKEEWKAFEEQGKISRMATEALANMVKNS